MSQLNVVLDRLNLTKLKPDVNPPVAITFGPDFYLEGERHRGREAQRESSVLLVMWLCLQSKSKGLSCQECVTRDRPVPSKTAPLLKGRAVSV
jgi:hypothetical protein